MFQTTPNLLLQAWGSDTWTALMRAVSAAGYESFFAVLVAVLIFGVSFRRGFLLLQLLLWSALVNSVLKDAIALPRPVHVDPRLLDDGAPNLVAVTAEAPAPAFWSRLPDDIVARVRAVVQAGGDDFGFPSGHVQSHTVLWGAAALLWDDRRLARLAPWAVLLMAVSRMHLGRHFLADVIGGAVMGLLFVLGLWIARRRALHVRVFERGHAALRMAWPNLWTWVAFVALPLAVVPLSPERGGALLGVGAAFLMVLRAGVPPDTGTPAQRCERVGMALVLYAVTAGLLGLTGSAVGLSGPWWACLSKAAPAFAMIWGTVAIAGRRGSY